MPQTTPPARYDLPWKAALTHAFHAFMDFFFPELSPQIDWSKRPRFRDKELAGIGFGAAPDIMVAAAKLQLTRQLFTHRWSRKRIIVLFKVINWMMVLPQSHQRRYWQEVLKLDKEYKMELMNPLEQMFFDDGVEAGLKQGMEKGLKQGREQGLEQGLEKGRKEGAVALLERQLTQRFGPLPQTARNKLAKASAAQLESWADALLEAQSLKQMFG